MSRFCLHSLSPITFSRVRRRHYSIAPMNQSVTYAGSMHISLHNLLKEQLPGVKLNHISNSDLGNVWYKHPNTLCVAYSHLITPEVMKQWKKNCKGDGAGRKLICVHGDAGQPDLQGLVTANYLLGVKSLGKRSAILEYFSTMESDERQKNKMTDESRENKEKKKPKQVVCIDDGSMLAQSIMRELVARNYRVHANMGLSDGSRMSYVLYCRELQDAIKDTDYLVVASERDGLQANEIINSLLLSGLNPGVKIICDSLRYFNNSELLKIMERSPEMLLCTTETNVRPFSKNKSTNKKVNSQVILLPRLEQKGMVELENEVAKNIFTAIEEALIPQLSNTVSLSR